VAPGGASYKADLPHDGTSLFVARPFLISAALLSVLTLAGCANDNPLRVVRSACPAVAIPAYTGETTLFTRPGAMDATDIDLVAAITNVRGACTDTGSELVTEASFDVLARRTDTSAARDVSLPWFAVVVRAGDQLVAKQMGQVVVHFEAGQDRASTSARARSTVQRSAVTLPEEIERKITRERKPGDEDAAMDPMAEPDVRNAVRAASFEVLVGFQLDEAQLAYNATR